MLSTSRTRKADGAILGFIFSLKEYDTNALGQTSESALPRACWMDSTVLGCAVEG